MIKTVSILGCGWLGLPLATQLVQLGYQVKGSTTTAEKTALLQAAGIMPFVFKVGEMIEGAPLDFFQADLLILNIPPGRRNPQVTTQHPKQVERIVHHAIQGGIQYLIFVSSSSVYGDTQSVVTEIDVPQPNTASGRALLQAEHFLQNHPSLQTTVLRMAGLFGPNRHPARFLAGKTGLKDADAPVNLVHLDDAMQAIHQVIRQNRWNTLYNICADEHPTRKAYYTQAALQIGLPAPQFVADDQPHYKIVSNQKAKTELGLDFKPLL
ncbi:MAG: SDR family oxidoreductase [Saprospiraceae bacterium]